MTDNLTFQCPMCNANLPEESRGHVVGTMRGICEDPANREEAATFGSDALGARFQESCGLDILGRIAAMLLDRDGFGDVYGHVRIIEALEMSASHFNDTHVYRMLDGIAADLAGGFHAADLESGTS